MSFLATNGGVSGEDVRDLMLAAVEHRFGPANRLPVTIAWLNGSCYLAGKTRSFARDIDLELENHADRKSTEQWNGRSLRPRKRVFCKLSNSLAGTAAWAA